MNNSTPVAPAGAAQPAAALTKRQRWEQAEGSPLPLGVTWIEEEQAFNFAVYAEHAESVTLLLYSSTDVVNPLLTFRFDFLRNKSGRIWHCRLPITEIGDARYYAYSASGQTSTELHSFDPQKVLLDPLVGVIGVGPVIGKQVIAAVAATHQVRDHTWIALNETANIVTETSVPLQPIYTRKSATQLISACIPGFRNQT